MAAGTVSGRAGAKGSSNGTNGAALAELLDRGAKNIGKQHPDWNAEALDVRALPTGFALRNYSSAVLAASVFHFGEITIPEAKRFLAARGIEMRT